MVNDFFDKPLWTSEHANLFSPISTKLIVPKLLVLSECFVIVTERN